MRARPVLWGEGLGNDPSYPAPAGRQRRPQLSYPSRQPVNHRPIFPQGSAYGWREEGGHDRGDDPARRRPREGTENAEGYHSHVTADPVGFAVCRQTVTIPIHVSY